MYSSFQDFYPDYLSQHSNQTCRRLHFVGLLSALMILFYALLSQTYFLITFVPLVGYGLSWIGHFFYEKNVPATFKHPLYSLAGDFVMFTNILKGKIKF